MFLKAMMHLDPGFYLVVFPPDNKFFQLLIGEGEQQVTINVAGADPTKPSKVSGSSETELFYDYVDFISAKRPGADALRKQLETEQEAAKKQAIEDQLSAINGEVEKYQDALVRRHPQSLTAMLIMANKSLNVPDYSGTDDEVNEQRYRYVHEHYFDHLPLGDDRIIRTPFIHEKIDYFINKLTVQDPDSISMALDRILQKMDPDGMTFQVYLVHFLNTYAQTKIVGMDAVYVHLVNSYYAAGKAPWTGEDQLKKIVQTAERLEPLLIGKIAPDITLQNQAGEAVRLHAIESEYVVLYFWAPDCGHCKKSLPHLVDFYNAYKDKGVEVLAVCTKLKDEVASCWETIEERGLDVWINAVDPFMRSRYKQIYDVRLTPRLYVLDRDKRITTKYIGSDQLPEVMELIMNKKS